MTYEEALVLRAQELLKVCRKVGPSDDRGCRRYMMELDERQRRGVRFLPSQVLRPLYAQAGLA